MDVQHIEEEMQLEILMICYRRDGDAAQGIAQGIAKGIAQGTAKGTQKQEKYRK